MEIQLEIARDNAGNVQQIVDESALRTSIAFNNFQRAIEVLGTIQLPGPDQCGPAHDRSKRSA